MVGAAVLPCHLGAPVPCWERHARLLAPERGPHSCSPAYCVQPATAAESVAKLVILNTPLGLKTPLRPELAAYKNPVPFLRPKAGAAFAGDLFNAAGGPYAMARRDADAYAGGLWVGCGACGGREARMPAALCAPHSAGFPLPSTPRHASLPPAPAAPYDDPAASAAVAATMDQLDFPALLRRVDQGYEAWRQPSLLLFGTSGARRTGAGGRAGARHGRAMRGAWRAWGACHPSSLLISSSRLVSPALPNHPQTSSSSSSRCLTGSSPSARA